MDSTFSITSELNARRRHLGMSCAVLAGQSGISLRTVQRVLSGVEKKPRLATVVALADCLGMPLHFQKETVTAVRCRQARRKARHLMAIVQGTSALEAQALEGPALRKLRSKTVKELLAGSPRRLWAN